MITYLRPAPESLRHSFLWRKNKQRQLGTFHFLSAPRLKMTGIRTLKFLSTPFEKWNPKGPFSVGTFEKFGRRHQVLLASLKEKSKHPLFLHWHYFVVVVVAEGSLSNDDNEIKNKNLRPFQILSRLFGPAQLY